MSRQTAHASTGQSRQSLYDEITAQIISQLEAGCVPWVQPWGTAATKASIGMPNNAATGRRYSGINVLILSLRPWSKMVHPSCCSSARCARHKTSSMDGPRISGTLEHHLRSRAAAWSFAEKIATIRFSTSPHSEHKLKATHRARIVRPLPKVKLTMARKYQCCRTLIRC
jgi:hypothetical protein